MWTNIIGSSMMVLAKGIFRVKCTHVSKPAEKLCIVYGKHLSRDNGAFSIRPSPFEMLRFTFYVRCVISRWITKKNHLQNTYVFTERKSFPWNICLSLPRTANLFLLQSYPPLHNFSSPNYVIAFKRNVWQRDACTCPRLENSIFLGSCVTYFARN